MGLYNKNKNYAELSKLGGSVVSAIKCKPVMMLFIMTTHLCL